MKRAKKQNYLKTRVGKNDETGEVVKAYKPHEPKTLPNKAKIGISRGFRISKNRVIGPLSEETTPGGENLNKILRKFGFLPSTESMDADHVQEIQFGGQDIVENLWPLEKSRNRSSGSTLKSYQVTYPKTGREVPLSTLKKRLRKYYFKIVKFKS